MNCALSRGVAAKSARKYTFNIIHENGYTVKMNRFRDAYTPGLKTLVFLVWLVLISMLVKRDVIVSHLDTMEAQSLSRAETEEFQSIYFQNKKIGFVSSRHHPKDDSTALLLQQAEMNINVADRVQHISLRLEAVLGRSNILQEFSFSFKSPFYSMTAEGIVTGNSVEYVLNTATSSIRSRFAFSAPPRLATTRRSYLLGPDLQKGDKKKIPWFDPVSLTGKESVVEYRGEESVQINGRVLKLHKFIETFSGVRVNSWLNGEGIVVKEESPAGFVFLREPKFKALAMPEGSDEILSRVAVTVIGSMVAPDKPSIRYRIGIPDGVEFDLSGANQFLDGDILTVNRGRFPEGSTAPRCPGHEDQLRSSPYIQADNREIREQALAIVGEETDPRKQVEKIGAWVFSNLTKQSVIGLPDALTTLHARQGDCNEHAALFAALARAAGVPARIAAGVTFHKSAFYYHAWNEVCLGEDWIAADATINQFPADATHIRFVVGELQEQVRIGALLGQLSIEPLHSLTP